MSREKHALLKPHDMDAAGISDAHVAGIDLDYRAHPLDEIQREALPEPILEGNPDWVDLYWRTWAIAYDRVRTPDPKTGFTPFCDAAFSENMFQWDTCFLIGFVRYATHALPVFDTLDNFYRKQHNDGYICREISSVSGEDFWPKAHPSAINPPLFADAEWRLYRSGGDRDRLRRVLPVLVRYFEWLEQNRASGDGVGYWTTALASGMDNTPRAFVKGGDDADKHYDHTWMCLTAQQALNALRLRDIAFAVGEKEIASRFGRKLKQMTAYIEENFWNEELGFYTDLDPDRELTDVLTPAGLWPLLASVTSQTRISKVAEVITDPKKFWRPHVVPSVSADHPTYHPSGSYWQGSVWPPMIILAIRAMMAANKFEIAYDIAVNHIKNVDAVFRDTGTLWENYSPENPRRGNVSRPEFVGWTGCGPIEGLLEVIIGIDVDAPARRITWRSTRDDRHGIKRLRFGDVLCSLVFTPIDGTIEYEATSSFTLVFHRGGEQKIIPINAGKGVVKLDTR